MTTKRSLVVFVGSALALWSSLTVAPLGAADIDTCKPINSVPFTINSPGVYCLRQNTSVVMNSGHAIEVDTSNVVVDLSGFQLNGGGNAASQAVGIHSGPHLNVTVRNGTVRGFFVGVFLGDTDSAVSSGHVVEDLRAHFNRFAGIRVAGRDSIVRNNLVYGTGGSTYGPTIYTGIGVQGGGGIQVLNNDVLKTSAGTISGIGISVACNEGCIIEGNRIGNLTLPEVGPPVHGIQVGFSNDVLVVNNRITKTNTGITFSAASGKYRDNLTSGVPTPFTGGTAVGLND